MLQAPACGNPLHITAAKARHRPERIGMVDQATPHQRHGFKAPVRVSRKTGHGVAVVHAPAILAAEVVADVARVQPSGWAQRVVAGRVGIVVVGTKQERIERGPLGS